LVKILAYGDKEAVIRLLLDASLDVAIIAIAESPELGLDDSKSISACVSKLRIIHPETVPVSHRACGNYLHCYLARNNSVSRDFDAGMMLGTDGLLA